jgi:hypothetical protein
MKIAGKWKIESFPRVRVLTDSFAPVSGSGFISKLGGELKSLIHTIPNLFAASRVNN